MAHSKTTIRSAMTEFHAMQLKCFHYGITFAAVLFDFHFRMSIYFKIFHLTYTYFIKTTVIKVYYNIQANIGNTEANMLR